MIVRRYQALIRSEVIDGDGSGDGGSCIPGELNVDTIVRQMLIAYVFHIMCFYFLHAGLQTII